MKRKKEGSKSKGMMLDGYIVKPDIFNLKEDSDSDDEEEYVETKTQKEIYEIYMKNGKKTWVN